MPAQNITTATSIGPLATDEIWYCKKGVIEVDDASFTDDDDGIPLTRNGPGLSSIAFGKGTTVHVRRAPGSEGLPAVLVRVATST